MIDELRIQGLGVIDEAVLPLGPGLTAVTGETGAGKTMVVTGLLLLFGGRGDAARVRTGAGQVSVDGRLRLPVGTAAAERVRAAGGELDSDAGGDELVLRRTVTAAGRSRAYVGGATAPVAVLGELAEHLLTVHGQADQLRLARPGAQRDALDRSAGIDLGDYTAAFRTWREAQHRVDERVGRAAELRREADLLSHGIAEIEAADPQPDEDAELAAAASRLAHAEELGLAARTAHDALLGAADDFAADGTDVSALLAGAVRALGHVIGADPDLDALAGRVSELAALTGDVGADLREYADRLDTDPARLAALEERRSVLTGLVRKYCDEPEPSLGAVHRWAERARARLAEIDVSDEAIAALRAECDRAAARAAQLAAAVSAARRGAAAKLGGAVSAELAGLAMAGARLEIAVAPRAPGGQTPALTVDGVPTGAGPDGADDVEFRFAAHAGAPALPLGRGASGGELSRVMLALEVCLAGSDPVPTMVFDEVDAGVGGRAAVEVGRRLARLARERQVLVVTHLAQVAAFADQHIVVHKAAGSAGATDGSDHEGAITVSDVRTVAGDDRLAELARMLGGADTATAREHAAELLATARSAAASR